MLILKPKEIKWNAKSNDARIKNLLDIIYTDLNLGTNKPFIKKKLLNVILLNLLYSSRTNRAIAYPRGNGWYDSLPSKYKYPYQTYRLVTKVIDALEEREYIFHKIGRWDMKLHLKELSEIRPTTKFKEMYAGIGTDVIEYEQPVQEIVLREIKRYKVKNPKTNRMIKVKEKNLKDYQETSETIRMRKVVKNWNNLRERTLINLELPSELVAGEEDYMIYYTDLLKEENGFSYFKVKSNYSHRVFINDFDTYGRFNGQSETLFYSDYRPYFKINGESTVEIDYESLHIRMLYNQEGINYQEDPYQVAADSYEGDVPEQITKRKLFKQIILKAINAEDKSSAIKATRDKLLEVSRKNPVSIDVPYEDLEDMLDHFLEVHEPIAKYLCSNSGLMLMNLDSRIAEKVIEHFTNQNVMVLCIHDSFIIQNRYRDELASVMQWAYQRVMENNFSVPLKIIE